MKCKDTSQIISRNNEIDVLKGIAMVMVIFDHIGWGDHVHTYIQSFHMPLFFILSGYLFKQKPLNIILARRVRSLLVPYFCFEFLYLILGYFFNLSFYDGFNLLPALNALFFYPTDKMNMPVATAMWFLPAMFFTSIIYSLLGKCHLYVKIIIILVTAVVGTIYSALSEIMLPLALEVIPVALLFMLIGECISDKKIDFFVKSKWHVILLFLLLEAVLSFVNQSVDMRSARYNIVPLYFLNAVMGTLAWWGIANRLINIKNKFGKRIHNELAGIGKNTIIYLCIHQLIILLMNQWLLPLVGKNIIFRLGVKFVTLIIVLFICKLFAIVCEHCNPLRVIFGMKKSEK